MDPNLLCHSEHLYKFARMTSNCWICLGFCTIHLVLEKEELVRLCLVETWLDCSNC